MTKKTAPRRSGLSKSEGLRFAHKSDHDSYDRHLAFDHIVSAENAGPRERFEAVARSLRDRLAGRWLLLPEALEKWPVRFFELVCPRLLEIIYEINRRFLDDVGRRYPGDADRQRRMSLVEETPARQVRMANLAIAGTHSTNGVAQIHSDLLRTRVVSDFAEMFPERSNNKTNGVTPRRWLLRANPDLSLLLTQAIGDSWVADLSQLRRLLPLADDAGFRARFRQAKWAAKERFAAWLKATTGQAVEPNTVFDSQVKRIHEYKRQLLNVLHIIVLYNRLRADPALAVPPRTFFFAGKAAPAYRLAKLIIKLINNVGRVIDEDPATRGLIKVVYLPNYNVTLAERLIAASDVSEQISTAGYKASGTGNMMFMLNGALTVGTRDGATIEMAQEAGEENFFLFGLTGEQVAWVRKAIINVACSGKFSSDRTIAEYAAGIWNATPCPVD